MNSEPGLKICFVAHNAYAALADIRLDHVGGVERQQAMMATWLAKRGHEVSMITWAQKEAAERRRSGVDLHFVCKKSDGVPIIRFIYPCWTSLISAMNEADADVYYYNLGDLVLGQIVRWARWKKKAVVYSVSSEPVCRWDLRDVLSLRERILYRYGLRNVDKIIVQTRTQADLIKDEYGRDAEMLPMPCRDLSVGEGLASPPDASSPPRVVWIGRLSAEKRPDWILQIAARCPNVRFDVIGQANRDTGYSRKFLSEAGELENVRLHGVVQHHDIDAFYRKAHVIVCTSRFEGFPNVFLEAWSMGLPTVTTFDPGSVVSREGIGFVGESIDDLVSMLSNLLSEKSVWNECSENARSYFVNNHEIEHAMPRFAETLRVFVNATSPKRAEPLKSQVKPVRSFSTSNLFGISVARYTLDEVVAIAERHIAEGTRLCIGVINAAKVVKMRKDDILRDAVCSSDLIIADGASIVLASKILGEALPERVTGIDLMLRLLHLANEHRSRVFLLGATEEVSEKVEAWIRETHPNAVICGRADGYFDINEESALVEKIRDSAADILFVAITSPKKEIFIARWEKQLGATVIHGVGGSFDVVAGNIKRAPLAFQKWGLEWFYRLIQEPRRLAWRYISTNTRFLLMLCGEFARRSFDRRTARE